MAQKDPRGNFIEHNKFDLYGQHKIRRNFKYNTLDARDESKQSTQNKNQSPQMQQPQLQKLASIPSMTSIQYINNSEHYIDTKSESLKLPTINQALVDKIKKMNDKKRFIMSKKTQEEFDLSDSDVPVNMRKELPKNVNYTNHVGQNIRLARKVNEINKIIYLSKIKFGIENQQSAMSKA